MSRVVKIDKFYNCLVFDDGHRLRSEHAQDCCEQHFLSFSDLALSDFDGLDFDLTGAFFRRVDGFGIELVPVSGWSVKVPGHSYNNGFYGDD